MRRETKTKEDLLLGLALLLSGSEALEIAEAMFSFQERVAARNGKKGTDTSFSLPALKWWAKCLLYWSALSIANE